MDLEKAANELQDSARKYRKLYEAENKKNPVVWIKNVDTGEGVFISDSYNTELIKDIL